MLIIVYLVIALLYELIVTPLVSHEFTFGFYTAMNLAICVHLITALYRRNGKMALLHPTALASMCFFGLFMGVTNIPYLIVNHNGLPASTWMVDNLGSSPFFYSGEVMFWSVIAQLCMWFGSQWGPFQRFCMRLLNSFTLFRRLADKDDIRIKAVSFLYVVSVLTKILMMILGVYGFAADPVALEKHEDIMSLLNISSSLGEVCFFLISIHLFRARSHRPLLVFITTLQIVFGLLAGFKSQVFMPFFILAFSYFYVNKKVNVGFIIGLVFTIQIAYSLVEPFRLQYFEETTTGKKGFSLDEIAEIYVKSQANKAELASKQRDASTLIIASDRINVTGPTMMAYKYYLNKGTIPEYKLPERLYFLPAMMFVPKSLWSSKPSGDIGNITYRKVFGMANDDKNSVSVSIIGYELLGYGTFLVIIPFFIVIGIVQNFFADMLYYMKLPGLIVYLVHLTSLFAISEISFFLIDAVRAMILGLFAQAILITRDPNLPTHD